VMNIGQVRQAYLNLIIRLGMSDSGVMVMGCGRRDR
jgi:hypothetical protein